MTESRHKLRTFPTLFPPLGFAFIEDTLCRCNSPIFEQNFPFLESLSLGSIVNISGSNLSSLEIFSEDNKIDMYNMHPTNMSSEEQHDNNIFSVILEGWIRNIFELIIPLSARSTVLIIGSLHDCLDLLIVACLRRMQRVSLTSTLEEFKILSGGKRIFDMEQFIEYFDPSIIELPDKNIPLYLLHYDNLKAEEEAEFSRHLTSNNEGSTINEKASSKAFFKLIFPPKGILLSPGLTFDASISLVHDKDDDD